MPHRHAVAMVAASGPGLALTLVRGGMSGLLLTQARRVSTKVAETAETLKPGNSRKPQEAAGKKRRILSLRKRSEAGSLAGVTAAMTEAEPDLRSVREAAEFCDVSTRSIINWIKAGRLKEYWTLGHGKRLVDFNELRRKSQP